MDPQLNAFKELGEWLAWVPTIALAVGLAALAIWAWVVIRGASRDASLETRQDEARREEANRSWREAAERIKKAEPDRQLDRWR